MDMQLFNGLSFSQCNHFSINLLLKSNIMLHEKHCRRKLPDQLLDLDRLKDGDVVLISEGCTHHRQCEDIGTVKIPRWIREYTGKEIQIETTSGTEFPDDLSKYKLIIHCGGCMLNEREMKYRYSCAADQGIPITNYGIMIAYVNGILKRSVELFPELYEIL